MKNTRICCENKQKKQPIVWLIQTHILLVLYTKKVELNPFFILRYFNDFFISRSPFELFLDMSSVYMIIGIICYVQISMPHNIL